MITMLHHSHPLQAIFKFFYKLIKNIPIRFDMICDSRINQNLLRETYINRKIVFSLIDYW